MIGGRGLGRSLLGWIGGLLVLWLVVSVALRVFLGREDAVEWCRGRRLDGFPVRPVGDHPLAMQNLGGSDRYLEENFPRMTMALKGSALLLATFFIGSE